MGGSVDISGTHSSGNDELEGSYRSCVERIRKGENQEDVEGSEEGLPARRGSLGNKRLRAIADPSSLLDQVLIMANSESA